MHKMKKILVSAVAVITGLFAFLLGAIKHPEIVALLNDSPDRAFLSDFIFVEVLSFTVFVACTCAFFVANRLNVPGFHPDEAKAWRVMATVPLIVMGPIAVVWLISTGAIADAVIHGVIVAGVIWNLIALNTRIRKASNKASGAYG